MSKVNKIKTFTLKTLPELTPALIQSQHFICLSHNNFLDNSLYNVIQESSLPWLCLWLGQAKLLKVYLSAWLQPQDTHQYSMSLHHWWHLAKARHNLTSLHLWKYSFPIVGAPRFRDLGTVRFFVTFLSEMS